MIDKRKGTQKMKHISILAVATMAMASAFADLSVATLTTEGANGDMSGDASRYTAYLCTAATASAYFGKSDYAGITDYLSESAANYTSGMEALAAGGALLDAYTYGDGEYSFVKDYQPGTGALSGDYIALVAYAFGDDSYFRVFESTASNEKLVFDPAVGGGSAGAWTVSPVPEPTSGLLLLLGFAGLALKRKRVR